MPDWPRTALLVENTTAMAWDGNGKQVIGRWKQLRDNVRQFILQEAAAESYVGVVLFGSSIAASDMLPLTDNQNREKLANFISEDSPTVGDKVLGAAIKRGVQLLGPQGGTLILVTQNVQEYTPPPNEDVVGAAENNPVWPILYPSEQNMPTQIYEQLAGISPDTSVLTIPNDILPSEDGYPIQSVDTSVGLHDSLLTAAGSPTVRRANGNCLTDVCNIGLQVSDNTAYISPAYVEVFKSPSDFAVISVTDPNGETIAPANQVQFVNMYQINTLQNGVYQVSITNSAMTKKVIAELWATPAPAPLNLEVSAWSPKGLDNLPYSKGSAPRLLATVTTNSSPVLLADVTAVVANKDSQGASVNITLNDNGIGADVTGQDGVYSGYLVGFQPQDSVDITLTATDNNGLAMMVTPSLRAAPTTQGAVACCGSKLNVSSLQLTATGNFAFTSSAVSGRFTGVSPGTLPPGQVTDLQAFRTGRDVTLSFTAPGAQLDQGEGECLYVPNAK
ncbi:Calcium-activated chloride channel regulator 1 [Portunus trituberculatus]|uniref:Calcium-activated chloride channel regulator 1 n=1 Tax=Portunus trituberculatus TaxID=210409 RepID=A0A5B7E718_PORTR|nr:Calcium-activated chloride channel regulator 1 [Portunus trituberculatus]